MEMVPEVFIDGFGEISFKHGMVRIALISLTGEEPSVRQRLVMTVSSFLQILQAQQKVAEKLERAGVIRAATHPEPIAADPHPSEPTLASPVAKVPNGARHRASPAFAQPKSPNFADG